MDAGDRTSQVGKVRLGTVSNVVYSAHRRSHRCFPLTEAVLKLLRNTLWPDTDLEATFTNDRNLQDVATDDSTCPKSLLTAFLPSPWADAAASSPLMAACIRVDFGKR